MNYLPRTSAAGSRRAFTNSTMDSSSRQVRAGVAQGSVISPALFNHFVSDCPIPDLDMTSYADHFTLLASAPRIMEVDARANQLCSIMVRCADGKQLAIAPQKSSMTLFISNNHHSRPSPSSANWRGGGSVEQNP